jgi:hypothetical protein
VPEPLGILIRGERPEAILGHEREAGAELPYPQLDALTSEVVLSALGGARVAVVTRDDRADILSMPVLQETERQQVGEIFGYEAQQRRGAWFLPEDGAVRTGYANLPFHFVQYSRFASGAARDDVAKPAFKNQPEALYFWAVLDPLFSALFRPLALRGPDPPKRHVDAPKEAWAEIDATYAALGIDGGEFLATMRHGGGWSRLRAHDQLAWKQQFIAHLKRVMPSDIGARYRAWASTDLVERYYAKAKRSQPLMRQVLMKPLQRTLIAFFGGDWLAFLRYLGETPNPAEQIATALPEPRLYVDAPARVSEVAERHGLAPEEVERILAAYWETPSHDTPIHRRVKVLREFWAQLDTIHARQASGMESLWGLVEEGEHVSLRVDDETTQPSVYRPGLYRQMLPADLLQETNDLWGGAFLPTYPDAVVTAVDPYARMNATFGPALRFWNGAALTAWFICEGPSSRTDMPGLAEYHRRDLAALEDLGCPVAPALFAELIEAEKKLGPPEPIEERVEDDDGEDITAGEITIRVTLTTSYGSRRAGFERLRDILTRHRRVWAAQYLEKYVRGLWETQLREAAREFNKLYEVKRKAPTLKQFAKHADRATNDWFGGDISQLYRAIGEKSPVTPARRRMLHDDASTFARKVFSAIGGKPTRWEDLAATIKGNDRNRQDAEWRAHQDREKLASASIRYVQLREALDRPPTLKEFGLTKFVFYAPVLDVDLIEKWGVKDYVNYVMTHRNSERAADAERAWERYSAAVERCLSA